MVHPSRPARFDRLSALAFPHRVLLQLLRLGLRQLPQELS